MVTPTESEVARIASLPDPILRNLAITHCYHRLALALADRTGREANWCTFAAWASKQAGQTIRREDLSRALEAALGDEETVRLAEKFAGRARWIGVRLRSSRLVDLMWRAVDPEAVFSHAGEAVAAGNLKVFDEIGRAFAGFYAACLADEAPDEGRLAAFLDGLRPGPPPDGQGELCLAFRAYYQALFEKDPAARSQLLFLANLRIGFHEQTRLQPEIVAALDAPVITPETFTRNLLGAYYADSPGSAQAVSAILRIAGRLVGFDAFVESYLSGARRQVQTLTTRSLMTIVLPPDRRLRLGADLAAGFPPSLLQITNQELAELLRRIDPTPDSETGSGAADWGDLADRIHFIADLFRAYHAAPELFDPPFTAGQLADLEAGRLPAGRL